MSERDIFTAARQMTDRAARSAYLDEACGGDPALRGRVEALLRAHERPDSLLDAPAAALPDPGGAATRLQLGPGAEPVGGPARTSPEGADALTFLSPPGRPDSLGRLGHYEVLGVLGHGGFGIVLRAFDEVLQRVVAVKVLAPQLAATSPARKRFLREARSSAQVRHENVVQVHAIEEQPLPYLVMEFIPGETLQQRLDRTGPLDVPEVVRIGRQVAEGLAAAHLTDLIHRDVKPANVLIESGPQARVKLTDFGLARAADDASISQSGVVAGTPLYMAPEQAQGEALDHRADLFSLGSVLYVMCTGRPPFRASSTLAVLKRVAEDEPRPIREVIPEVPVWLCRVVEKLHAKDPDARFQSARAVADALADCEAQLKRHGALSDLSRIPGGQSPRPRRRQRAWVAGPVALLLLLGGAVWCGPPALRYLRNTSEIEVLGDRGLTSVIVHRDGDAITDWFDVKTRPTITLPPGKCKLEPGVATGRTVKHWEITTHGLFSDQTLVQFRRAPEFEVARGERVTVRAVLSDAPVGGLKPEAAAALPDPAVVQALRDLVVAKKGTRDKAVAGFAAAAVSRMEVLDAEIDLTEARIRLAEAERDKARVCTLLEELVTRRQEERGLTESYVEAGRAVADVLNQVDARLADARARLAQARSK
jgi:serine/threonine protein kinase